MHKYAQNMHKYAKPNMNMPLCHFICKSKYA